MPATYIAITTVNVTSGAGAASITFSSIPQTYTDLLLLGSTRGIGYTGAGHDWIKVNVNGNTGSIYTATYQLGQSLDNPGGYSGRTSSATWLPNALTYPSAAATADVFGNLMIYFTNYTSTSLNKATNSIAVNENNSTGAINLAAAGLINTTAAISSISLTSENGTGFAQHSTATLYGISATV